MAIAGRHIRDQKRVETVLEICIIALLGFVLTKNMFIIYSTNRGSKNNFGLRVAKLRKPKFGIMARVQINKVR